MYSPSVTDFFDLERCDLCGLCMEQCPVFGDSVSSGGKVIGRLVRGDYDIDVLNRCTSCMSCNALCPYDCNPYGLIMFNWFHRYLDRGVPARMSLIFPLDDANAYFGATKYFPPDEKRLVEDWTDLGRDRLHGSEGAMFAGCNLQAMPYLTFSSLFDGYDIFGAQELCCGELYFRTGLLHMMESQAKNLRYRLNQLGLKELTIYCQACYNIMNNLYPRYFGVDLGVDMHYYGEVLSKRVLSGELDVKDRLKGLKVTVHDPCHAKSMGRDFMDGPRKTLEYMGVEVIEMKHEHELGLCCGAGHFVSTYNPIKMVSGIMRRLNEARSTKADYLVVYCNTCYMILTGGVLLTPIRIPVIHLNELVSTAMGESTPRRNKARVGRIMQNIFLKGAGRAISPRWSYVDPISLERDSDEPQP